MGLLGGKVSFSRIVSSAGVILSARVEGAAAPAVRVLGVIPVP